MKGNKLRIAALISGGGTTMQSVIQACKTGRLAHAEVVCVVASKPEAGGIRKALAEGLTVSDVLVCRPKDYVLPEIFCDALLRELRARGVDLVAQLGWLPLTPAAVVEAYEGMIINQHPGPLRTDHRDFGGKGMYGRRVHAARINFVQVTKRNFWTEAVCHRVTAGFDLGAVINVRRVDILPGDDVPALQARVLPVEHEVQIEAIDEISQNRVEEIVFHDDLVRRGEERILQLAKDAAIREWPQG